MNGSGDIAVVALTVAMSASVAQLLLLLLLPLFCCSSCCQHDENEKKDEYADTDVMTMMKKAQESPYSDVQRTTTGLMANNMFRIYPQRGWWGCERKGLEL